MPKSCNRLELNHLHGSRITLDIFIFHNQGAESNYMNSSEEQISLKVNNAAFQFPENLFSSQE